MFLIRVIILNVTLMWLYPEVTFLRVDSGHTCA